MRGGSEGAGQRTVAMPRTSDSERLVSLSVEEKLNRDS